MKSAGFWGIARHRAVIFTDVSGLFTREDGTDTLFRNVGKQLPHDAA
jgi:hypothetical protein